MIPKVIHYCWFGGNPKPEVVLKCIESWKHFCPDWEIIEWNESNYDVNKSVFMKEAYSVKKWGFVPDYGRFDIVNMHGGVYFDTDIELLAPIDDLLKFEAFFAFETQRNLACGLGFGSEKNHFSMDACLSYYMERHFIQKGKMDQTPSPRINTESLLSVFPELRRDGSTQVIGNVLFMSCSDYSKYMKNHAAGTWIDYKEERNSIYHDTRLKRFLRKPSHYDFIEKHFGKKAVRLYEVISYDLMEYGIAYYIRRTIRKIRKK